MNAEKKEETSTTMEAKSIATKITELISPWPLAGGDGGDVDRAMRLRLATQIGEQNYTFVVEFIEFQRRLMNQQFDNLLDQLSMFRASYVDTLEIAEECDDDPIASEADNA